VSREEWADWFERAWAVREEEVYPRLFGSMGETICVLTPDMFTDTFKQESFDPRWLTYGVFECPPTPERRSWLYVSSGLSNAWEDDRPNPDGPSGLGMEFVLETPEQAPWAILRLQHVVVFQILIACGRYPGRDLLDVFDRIPLRCSISPEASELSWLMIAPPRGYASTFRLPTGSVDILTVVGISEDEAALARSQGGDVLLGLLRAHDAYPVTNPKRASLAGAGR
jgi:hypothetical protein